MVLANKLVEYQGCSFSAAGRQTAEHFCCTVMLHHAPEHGHDVSELFRVGAVAPSFSCKTEYGGVERIRSSIDVTPGDEIFENHRLAHIPGYFIFPEIVCLCSEKCMEDLLVNVPVKASQDLQPQGCFP